MSSPCSAEPPRKRGRRSSHSPIHQPETETNNAQFPERTSNLTFNFIRDDLIDDSSDDPDFQADPSTSDDNDFDEDSDDDNGDSDNSDDDDNDEDGGDESRDEINHDVHAQGSALPPRADVAHSTVENTFVPIALHRKQNHRHHQQPRPSSNTDLQDTFDMCSNTLTNPVPVALPQENNNSNQLSNGALNHQNLVFDVDDLDSALDEDEQDDPLYQYSGDSCTSSDATSSDELPPIAQQSQTHLPTLTHPQNGSRSDSIRNERPQDKIPNSLPSSVANTPALTSGPSVALSTLPTLNAVTSRPIVPGHDITNAVQQNNGDDDDDGNGNDDDDDPNDPDYQVNPTEDDGDDFEDADIDPGSEVNNAHYIEFLTNLLTTGMTPALSPPPISAPAPASQSIDGTGRTLSATGSQSNHFSSSIVPTPVCLQAQARACSVAIQAPSTLQYLPSSQGGLTTNDGALDIVIDDLEGQDDDDDFDYLRESAGLRDDPLEYRDDMTVPVEEVMQLLAQPDAETALRPTTRASNLNRQRSSMPTIDPLPHTSTAPRLSSNTSALIITDSISLPNSNLKPSITPSFSQPFSTSNNLCNNDYLGSNGPVGQREPALQVHPSMIPLDSTSRVAFVGLDAGRLAQFKQQLAAYAQIATHVHAQLAQKYRVVNESSQDEMGDAATRVGVGTRSTQNRERVSEGGTETNSSIVVAYKRSEGMLKRFVKNGKLSRDYHSMMRHQIQALQPMANRLLGVGVEQQRRFDSWRSGVLDINLIDKIDGFVRAVSSKSWDGGDKALRLLKAFWRPDVTNALHATPQGRRLTDGGCGGSLVWTPADDFLLALTIAKYGREFGELNKDLLPHRDEEDCHRRVRYLASRRCGDNPVKRQVLYLNSPLQPEEIRLMEEGVRKFGHADDCETWKRIQHELLPNRGWSHLQRIWNLRQSRRKYKANYRAKLAEKRRTRIATNGKDS